ncbi:MAG: FKBP-type peptidyl-prolyl cis-trans isomerase [Porphyromonas sp.]|nr:FKBP-type peptidyl-prolyl cis-trans isomerase [Porphyromonas sp.]
MSKYIIKIGWLVTLTFAFLLTSCNETVVEVVTEYQKKNEAFVDLVSKDTRYKELRFLHEEYPIYYKVLATGPAELKDEKPLQNSRVSVFLKGVIPALQLLELDEVKALKDVTPLIAQGEVFQHKGKSPTPLRIQDKEPSGSPQLSLIKGVQIALQNMSVGDKWEVVIPWQLGYKQYDYMGVIPGFSTLVFEVELIEILEK